MNEKQPGAWPVQSPIVLDETDEQGQQHLRVTAAQARFHLTLGSIRADFEEQPSEVCLRAAARRWQNAITALADETARWLKKTG